ncbi:MAG: nucleotidyltransferase domain-containing protein [Nitrospirae bacterium]|nr:nucleotidyltransferase domain-containing protein [Nitrospirota bacterium]
MKITDEQKFQLEEFSSQHGIRFIVLFGSQVNEFREFQREDSYYDIAVSLCGIKSVTSDFKLYSQILDGLCTILNIPYEKIDLADLDKANVLLRYEITFRGQLLFGYEMDYLELKSVAFREYIDAKGLRELESCLINKRQRLIMDALTEITSK